ncbi:COMM domain-containing protein 4-like [Tubulanus polymorphus]|uniref:COMM domain-containing protein 4-like n=1 Tax=Tubulanus polymorphus TaxID=672921 RepID=UPI003DA283E2
MKFRFCGDLDCPDWVLAEISTLAKMTSVKMKLLCIQVVKSMLADHSNIDYAKVQKLTADAKFDNSDIKASIACLELILSNATKYSVDGETLSNELQQLGLPKEHSVSLCKTYSDNHSKLHTKFKAQSLRLSSLESIDWRVDYVISSSELQDVNKPCVQLQLTTKDIDGNQTAVSFTASDDKFRLLLNDMKQALSIMENVSGGTD